MATETGNSLEQHVSGCGPDTENLHDPCRVSRELGILRSRREHDRKHERPDAVDTGMHTRVYFEQKKNDFSGNRKKVGIRIYNVTQRRSKVDVKCPIYTSHKIQTK